MTIVGNLCLGLALLIYASALQFVLHDSSGRADGGVMTSTILVLIPIWVLITVGLCVGTSRGALDWALKERVLQYLAVIVGCVSLAVLSALSAIGKSAPPEEMPWAAKAFVGWGLHVLPLTAIAVGFVLVNASLAAELPPLAYRVPLAALLGIGLLAGAGMLGQLFILSQKRAADRVERVVAEESERDKQSIQRIKGLDPDQDFPELLGYTNRFNEEAVRQAALERIRQNPNFAKDLTQALSGGWAERGLIYVDACEIDDPKTFADPVRLAILEMAKAVRDSVRTEHYMQPDWFDFKARLVLSAATKLKGNGVDFVPAMREFRAAMDEPRTQKVKFIAAGDVDRWLADGARGK